MDISTLKREGNETIGLNFPMSDDHLTSKLSEGAHNSLEAGNHVLSLPSEHEGSTGNATANISDDSSILNPVPCLDLGTLQTDESGWFELRFSMQNEQTDINNTQQSDGVSGSQTGETPLPEGEFLHGPNTGNSLPVTSEDNHFNPTYQGPTADLKVHRVNIVNEMIGIFKAEDITQSSIQFSFVDEVGYDATGVSREAYTLFWDNFMASSADGETYRIPALNPDFGLEEWQSIGRILSKGYKDHKVFPLALAPVFFIGMMFGEEMVSPEELLNSYYLFVSESDRDVLQSAIMGNLKDEDDKDILLELLEQEGVRYVPSNEHISQTVIQMAHKALIQKSSYALQIMSHVVQKELLGYFTDIDAIKTMYECLTPTSKRVCQLLKADPQNNDESQSLRYFQQFIRAQKEEGLAKLLHFLTGSRVISVDTISIEFTKRKGMERRPVAHTCGPVLELPSTYIAYRELRNEFEAVLSSGYLKMDIL